MANKRHLYNSISSDVRAEKELLYPNEVIEALKAEKDPIKRGKILRNARINSINKEIK